MNIEVKYPQITGLKDSALQTKINSTIKTNALRILKLYGNAERQVELKIKYEIGLKTPKILSIAYQGTSFSAEAAYPSPHFYTTNIDMETGEIIRLTDVINIDTAFAQKIIAGNYKALRFELNEALMNHFKNYTDKQLQQYLMQSDAIENIGTEKPAEVFSYFTADSLCISVGVPHALGDHAEIIFKYQDIKNNIKTENKFGI